MDLKNPRQDSANFSHNNDCANVSTQKNVNKKKWLRIFAAGGLAFFMGVGTLCGVLIAPMGATSASNSGDPAAFAQSADSALTPQEQLLAGTLELDPENDPVVYTTDYGLEIKSHNANGLLDISSTGVDIADGTTTVSSTTWHYISAGGYNWIIIGSYSSSSYTISTLTGSQYLGAGGRLADDTPAGTAVEDEALKQVVKTNDVTIPAFSNAAVPSNGEIPVGCVLCLLSGNYTDTTFGSDNVYYSSSGVSSNLRTFINDTIYPLVEDLPIVPQALTTAGSESTTEHLFPLGSANRASTESFPVENYLNSDTKRNIGTRWWLRSSSASDSDTAHYVLATGRLSTHHVPYGLGVRPAFVLQLYSA